MIESVRGVAVFLAGIALMLSQASTVAAQESEPDARASVVVTTQVLGSVVGDLTGDAADVLTLMSGTVDPHSWQPSARDSEAIFGADLIIANGLDLEEGLVGVLEQAEADGVPVFHAAEHVELRASTGAGAVPDGDADPAHAAGDPHFWLDPMAMRDVVIALGPVLTALGVDLEGRAEAQAAQLAVLDAELRSQLASVPEAQRRLVTGHGALGYYADAYDLQIVGTVVPGLSSSDEPSARDIAELVAAIRDAGATIVFSDVGTPQGVADAVAAETGAPVVELQVAQLPDDGNYSDLLRELTATVADALSR